MGEALTTTSKVPTLPVWLSVVSCTPVAQPVPESNGDMGTCNFLGGGCSTAGAPVAGENVPPSLSIARLCWSCAEDVALPLQLCFTYAVHGILEISALNNPL